MPAPVFRFNKYVIACILFLKLRIVFLCNWYVSAPIHIIVHLYVFSRHVQHVQAYMHACSDLVTCIYVCTLTCTYVCI